MTARETWKASERFWNKVEKTDGCWIWRGGSDGHGYGAFWLDGRMQKAHRVSFESESGAIPDGAMLDHLCMNPPCVRPDHLEVVTNAENIRRAYASLGRCRNGHEKTGNEVCRECQKASRQRRHDKRMEYQRTYRAANPGRHAAYERQYREAAK